MFISDYRRIARENLAGKWGTAILAALIAALFGALVAGSNFSLDFEIREEWKSWISEAVLVYLQIALSIGGILGLVQFILGGAIQLGYSKFLLNMHDGKEAGIHDLFSQMDRFGTAFLMNLLRGLFITLWTLLFIIPGIIATYRYAMAPFILAENPYLTANDAIKESKELMRGNKMSLFLLGLSFIGWDILCILSLGIGYIWLNPYKNAAYAAFYRTLSPIYTKFQPSELNTQG